MTCPELEHFMQIAIDEARLAAAEGDVPVGACLVMNGQVLSKGHNRREMLQNPLAHAEIEVLKKAASVRGSWNLSGATVFVTLEPCPMCTGALLQAHVEHIVFGAFDGATGCCGTLYNLPEDPRLQSKARVTGGILRQECASLLTAFFQQLRIQSSIY